jgi:hypothetical protein
MSSPVSQIFRHAEVLQALQHPENQKKFFVLLASIYTNCKFGFGVGQYPCNIKIHIENT